MVNFKKGSNKVKHPGNCAIPTAKLESWFMSVNSGMLILVPGANILKSGWAVELMPISPTRFLLFE